MNETTTNTELTENGNVPDGTHIEEPENSLPTVTVEDLPPRLLAATQRAGWSQLTPVQAKAMPYIMAGRPMMVQARTGSGKTGAFLMPLIELVNRRQAKTQALVLVPTRELAQQVVTEATMLFGDDGVRVTAVYGGVSYGPQRRALREGTHLIVGTPGRILDHLQRGTMSLDDLKLLIFDEADRMLGMGFYPDMCDLQAYLPNPCYTCMFSATFPSSVRRLAHQFMVEPEFLSLSRDQVHVTDTTHQVLKIASLDKDRMLAKLLELENPDSAIIFCNTKQRVHYVAVVLQRFGYNADELSGDLHQRNREKVMGRLRRGELRFLVSTDVAARGIDISELSHVFQYEVPEDPELYIHRAGRTGRAGAKGTAITLVGDFNERMQLKRIAKQYSITFEEIEAPDDAALTSIVGQRLTTRLEQQMKNRDKLQVERMQRFVPMVKDLAENEHGTALIAMLLDDYYQASLHAPPAVPDANKSQSANKSSKPQQEGQNRGKRRRRSRNRSKNKSKANN